jgi:hypothetical protein
MARFPVSWRVFLAVQTIAIISAVACGQVAGPVGKLLWSAGFLLLLPGNITAAPAIEAFVWDTHVPLKAVTVIGVLAAVLTNALVWWMILAAIRHLMGRIGFTPAGRSIC